MAAKDWLTLGVGLLALAISILTFALTFRQRAIENRRALRKSLTDTIAGLTSISLERAKFDLDNIDSIDDQIMTVRRLHNTQRRYLATHAEFLIGQIPELVTDIDYSAVAVALDAIGDYQKAQKYWQLCVAASPNNNALHVYNLRGYAMFLYRQGNAQLGGRQYEESLQLGLEDTDSTRRLRSDTCLMWSKSERDYGTEDEARRLKERAVSYAQRIGHTRSRNEWLDYIEAVWRGAVKEPPDSVIPMPLPVPLIPPPGKPSV